MPTAYDMGLGACPEFQEKQRGVKGAARYRMPGSGVSKRLRVDTFLILSSMKLPLIVGAAVGVVVGDVVGIAVEIIHIVP